MNTVPDVVICEPIRTAIGGYDGIFKSLSAVDRGVAALTGLLQRTKVDPGALDDEILHCNGNSEGPAISKLEWPSCLLRRRPWRSR